MAVSYYRSLGSRMVWTEFESLEALRSSLAAGERDRGCDGVATGPGGSPLTARTKCSYAGFKLEPHD